MAGVLLRTAGGTLLFVAFLWLVSVDDYRIAGMLLTFPMLNGIGLVSAGANAERSVKAMVPVITLNGLMCFLFVLVLIWSESARRHPAATTAAAALAWVCIYALLETGNVAFRRSGLLIAYVAGCAIAALGVTYWLWPGCPAAPVHAVVRAGGLAGVLDGWISILLFATSLAILLGFAHAYRDAYGAIGRLAALPIVPLFGLYTAATAAGADAAALAKLDTLRSMILVGWLIALIFAVLLARYVVRTASARPIQHVAVLLGGWALCLALIIASSKVALSLAGCV